ncbi:MAG: hypothetical protein RLP15_12965 [Cryomorphaceae bacterium]
MSFEVNLSIERKYVRALLTGGRIQSADVEAAKGLLRKICDACEENGLTKAMVINALEGPLNHSASFQLIDNPEGLGWRPHLSAAIVYDDKDADSYYRFNALVAAKRGLNMRFFSDENQARRWLLTS